MTTLDEAICDYLYSQKVTLEHIPDNLEYGNKKYKVIKIKLPLPPSPEGNFTYIKVEVFNEKDEPVFLIQEKDKSIMGDYIQDFDLIEIDGVVLLKIKKSFYTEEGMKTKIEYFSEGGEKVNEIEYDKTSDDGKLFLGKIKKFLFRLFKINKRNKNYQF